MTGMTATDEAELIRTLYDAINRHDDAAVADRLAPDMVRHDLSDMVPEREGSAAVGDFLQMLHAAMPDLHMQVEDVFGTGDGRAAARTTLTGTHAGEFLGVAASGKRVSFNAITLYRIAGGRIAEAWSLVDWAGALAQMRGGPPEARS